MYSVLTCYHRFTSDGQELGYQYFGDDMLITWYFHGNVLAHSVQDTLSYLYLHVSTLYMDFSLNCLLNKTTEKYRPGHICTFIQCI